MEELCDKLHELFNSMPRYNFDNIDEVPFNNGVYIFFEKGEKYGNLDRIVRVGTDTGQNNLISRLKQHLQNENKDRSVFRKNIGRAMLNKEENFELLKYWNYDLTTRAKREELFDIDKSLECKKIEKKVSDYMQNNFSFTIFPLETKEERLRFEEAIISALYNSKKFLASDCWLGNYVQETRGTLVKQARMWLSQGLKAKPLTDSEFLELKKICEEEKSNEDSFNRLHKEEKELSLSC